MTTDPLEPGENGTPSGAQGAEAGRCAVAPASASDVSPINILIVDDDPKNLTVLESVLDNPAYRLVRAESADEALLALVVEDFALIILDIRMPGMSGFELAKMIKDRRKTAQIPLIFLTAYYNEDQHVLEGYGSGAVDYLYKPVNAVVLRSKVAIFAALYHSTREAVVANRALLSEVAERRRIDEQLRELNESLERRVVERSEALFAGEERYRTLFESAPMALFVCDCNAVIRKYNSRAAELWGREPLCGVERHCGSATMFLPDGTLVPDAQSPVADVLRTGLPVNNVELLVERPDGSRVPVLANFMALKDAQGGVCEIVISLVDITERKQLEARLREQAAELSVLHRRKDEFLAMLSHELRNPLAAISNAVNVLGLQRDKESQIQEDARGIIERQLDHLRCLVDDLLEVSRITTGQIKLRPVLVLISDIVARAVEAVRPLVEQRRHELRFSLPPEPVLLHVDAARIQQVLVNLLTNAAKYMDDGGDIFLSVQQEGNEVVARVRDRGVGISPELLPHVFDLFTQADRSLERSQGGLGIGLTLVKRLVELHQGRVEVNSSLANGSEFIVRLPLPSARHVAPPPPDSAEITRLIGPSLRVLVVDDGRDVTYPMSILLTKFGHLVQTASDGPAALQSAICFLPDVVLLDIGLPGMNGFEVARRLRQEPLMQNAVLVALTGYGQEADFQRSREAGFDHHLVKPADIRKVLEILATITPVLRPLAGST